MLVSLVFLSALATPPLFSHLYGLRASILDQLDVGDLETHVPCDTFLSFSPTVP